jgi:hypothetical protein
VERNPIKLRLRYRLNIRVHLICLDKVDSLETLCGIHPDPQGARFSAAVVINSQNSGEFEVNNSKLPTPNA